MSKSENEFADRIRAAIRTLEEGGQLSGTELAFLVSGLVELELEPGGPYAERRSSAAIRTPDAGFNLLVAYFLSLIGVRLPKLEAFVAAALEETVPSSWKEEGMAEVALRWRRTRGGKAGRVSKGRDRTPEETAMLGSVLEAAERRFSSLPPEVREAARQGIAKTIRGNRDGQMTLMAFHMRRALGNAGEGIPDSLIAEMGLANVFFWTAFIIYDDFWDEDEGAEPHLLPAANLMARSYVDYFGAHLPESTGFRIFLNGLMDKLDGANTWETVYCRTPVRGTRFVLPECLPDYGDYENKFLPSAGHILGPVALLCRSGYGVDSPEVRNLIDYFRHYLIAMQINDDAHDWEEDMRRGHLSTVVVMLLQDLAWPAKEIDLEADLPRLKEVFWFRTITRAAETALAHAQKSRQALQALDPLEDPAPLERFIAGVEEVAGAALRKQQDSVAFLESYGK
jgi:hypothetical protein